MNSRPNIRAGEGGFTMVELLVASALTTILVIVVSQLIMQTSEMARIMIHRVAINAEARQMFEMAANGVVRDLDTPASAPDATNPRDRIAGFRGATHNNASGWNADNSQIMTYHWNDPTNTNAPSSNQLVGTNGQTHAFRANFNKLTFIYNRLSNNIVVSSSGYPTITCTGLAFPHPGCLGTESVAIGYLFNRDGFVDAAVINNNRLVDFVNGNALNQNTSSIRTVNLRLQLVDPYYLVEQWQLGNIAYGYPTTTVVGQPPDGNVNFLRIPNDYRESYRTSFNMVVDY